MDSGDALEALTSLVDSSLVAVTETPEGDIRVTMLATVREYAHDELVRANELEATQRRHAEYYTHFAELANAELHGARHVQWLDRLEIEHDNLRAALTWTLDVTDPVAASDHQRTTLGLRLVNALSDFWYGHSHVADGRRWLEQAIDRSTGNEGTDLAEAIAHMGWMLLSQGEPDRAKAAFEQNLVWWHRLGDPVKLAKGLNAVGVAYLDLGVLDLARQYLNESLTIGRAEHADDRTEAALHNLAYVDMDCGDPKGAIPLLEESVALCVRLQDPYAVTSVDWPSRSWLRLGDLRGPFLLAPPRRHRWLRGSGDERSDPRRLCPDRGEPVCRRAGRAAQRCRGACASPDRHSENPLGPSTRRARFRSGPRKAGNRGLGGATRNRTYVARG